MSAKRGKLPNDVDELMRRFGINFQAARLARGFETQTDFAEQHGYSHSYISRVENGRMRLRFGAMVDLANLVDEDVIDLLAPPPPHA